MAKYFHMTSAEVNYEEAPYFVALRANFRIFTRPGCPRPATSRLSPAAKPRGLDRPAKSPGREYGSAAGIPRDGLRAHHQGGELSPSRRFDHRGLPRNRPHA